MELTFWWQQQENKCINNNTFDLCTGEIIEGNRWGDLGEASQEVASEPNRER